MDDLRATAERLIRIAEGTDDDDDCGPPPFEAFDDQAIACLFAPFVRYWLSQHPLHGEQPREGEVPK